MQNDKVSWNGVSLTKRFISTEAGEVPVLYRIPEKRESDSVIVAFHYYGGSKEIWLDEEHDPLLAYAVQAGIPFIACDVCAHGEWEVPGLDASYFDEDQWAIFAEKSRRGVAGVINSLAQEKGLSMDALHFVGVSMGCYNAMTVIRGGMRPASFVMAAPVPGKSYDDGCSFHNNLEAFTDTDLLVLSGRNDEENQKGEVQWLYDQIESDTKKLTFYDSGHELPGNWMDSIVRFLKSDKKFDSLSSETSVEKPVC